MDNIKSFWQSWKQASRDLSRWILPAAVCFLEFLFHFWLGGSGSGAVLLNLLGFSLAFGGILNLLMLPCRPGAANGLQPLPLCSVPP